MKNLSVRYNGIDFDVEVYHCDGKEECEYEITKASYVLTKKDLNEEELNICKEDSGVNYKIVDDIFDAYRDDGDLAYDLWKEGHHGQL